MTLDEAIKILTIVGKSDYPTWIKGFREATGLGSEALKLVNLNRELWGKTVASMLPGETEE